MLNQGEYCRSKGIGGELPGAAKDFVKQREILAQCCAALCEEIHALLDEKARLVAENHRLQAELDALNSALEDDGK